MQEDTGVRIGFNQPNERQEEPVEVFENLPGATRRTQGGAYSIFGKAAQFQTGLLTLPLNLLPSRTRYHIRNSIREGFLAFKAIVDDVNGGIDEGLYRGLERDRLGPVYKNEDNKFPPSNPPTLI